jgi:hypothetical protein
MKKLFALLVLLTVSTFAVGQAITTSGGSIQGTITDPSGAVIPGATIVITDPDTGYTHTLTSDKAGYYVLGPLVPGTYVISVSAPNFESFKETTTVRIGTVASGSIKLPLGKSTETVEVTTGVLTVNTDQIGVAGIVTREQIDSIPVNGRNILDIAQIQPGVILEDGQNFDPTKAGYEAISTGGVGGRTTRILLDGQDITDETVGTTIFNVPSGAVDEFQLNRSTQDISGEVTSTGQVLVSTQSGTNTIHGSAFYNFQNNTVGYAPVDASPASPFQRNQMGGYFGGPILKDKLFFFGGIEHILQHASTPAQTDSVFTAADASDIAGDPYLKAPITTLFPSTPSPFHDTYTTGRLDYNAPKGIHVFARISYSVNYDDANFGLTPYAIYTNRDNVPAYVGGIDATTGKFTHSFRAGYEKFHNLLVDGTAALGSSIYNPSTSAANQISLVGDINAGPNYLAPQGTYQSEKQFRYDGTYTSGKNSVKFGYAMSRILGGGFAEFYGASLYTGISATGGYEVANCGNNPSLGTCAGDPTNGYFADVYVLGNGNGLFSERPAFGLAGGGSPSWRFSSYLGDTYKLAPSFTLVAGLRWSVDTDRANQDLPTPLCSSVASYLQFAGCTGNTPLFNQYGSTTGSGTLGYKTHQPYANFGPQLGFVFSPGAHKLSLRAGIGIYYESDIFNNTGNSRTESIQSPGAYFNYGVTGPGGGSIYLPGANFPGVGASVTAVTSSGTPCTTPGTGGCQSLSSLLFEPISVVAPILNGLKAQYQSEVQGVAAANPSYIGTGDALNADDIYAGPYKSPYSIQYNGGVQYEVKKGIIFSADYLHNSTLKVPLSVDVNRVGAATTYNLTAARNAVTTVTSAYGCAGAYSAAAINCAIANGASLVDFSAAGLDSSAEVFGGAYPASASCNGFGICGLTPSTGAAFAGVNANVGQGLFILPIGRSGYDALQLVLQQQKAHPAPGILDSNFQVSYSLSRVVSTAAGNEDQFFAGARALDNDAPTKYIGRNSIDHSNEVSFGGSSTFGVEKFSQFKLNVGFTGHFFSAAPSTLGLDANNAATGGAGQIYQTDLDGDGTVGDILPGTNVGAYMHQVKTTAQLNKLISGYNTYNAGQVTPAGQQLLSSGLFTKAQLTTIGAVQNPIALAPGTILPNSAFRTFDLSAGIPIPYLDHIRKGLSITPTVAAYNVFNMANFDGLSGTLLNAGDSGCASPTSTTCVAGNSNIGHLNGPNSPSIENSYRTQRGAGVFDQGAPRTIEFQLKINY